MDCHWFRNGALSELVWGLLNFDLLKRPELGMSWKEGQLSADFVIDTFSRHALAQRFIASIMDFLIVFTSTNITSISGYYNFRFHNTGSDYDGFNDYQRPNVIGCEFSDGLATRLWLGAEDDGDVARIKLGVTNFGGMRQEVFLLGLGLRWFDFRGYPYDVPPISVNTFTLFPLIIDKSYIVRVDHFISLGN